MSCDDAEQRRDPLHLFTRPDLGTRVLNNSFNTVLLRSQYLTQIIKTSIKATNKVL